MTIREEDKVMVIIQFHDSSTGGHNGPPSSYWFWNTELLEWFLEALVRHQIYHTVIFRTDKVGT